MDVPAEETLSTGNLSLPPEMVWAALCFLDGRSLATFEIASQGTRQAVLDNLELYKTLLLRQVDNIPHVALHLPRKEGKCALMAWEAGDFQPVHARGSRRAPQPRYLHRVAEAADGWTYLHGGHLDSGLLDDVWRFRVSDSKGRQGASADNTALKLRWEQVWGDNEAAGVEDAGDGSSSSSSSTGGEDVGEEELDDDAPADSDDAGAAAAPLPAAPLPEQMIPALAVNDVIGPPPPPVVAFDADPQPPVNAAMVAANNGVHGVGFEDAAAAHHADSPRPRPRCAASWTWKPGTNKIYLFGGQGSENAFLGDLWCFHAGGRGQCRWEILDHVREPRPSGGEGAGANDPDARNVDGGAAGPWRVPDGRWGHTMIEHRGFLYMFGGSSPGRAYSGLWRLDTTVSPCVWSLMTPGRDMAEVEKGGSGTPAARGGHSATLVHDSLYIFGGNILESVFKDLWVVDLPACKGWHRVPHTPEFPLARIGHSAVAVGKRILMFGGRNFNTRQFMRGLSCFDVDSQAFVRLAFSKESSHGGSIWDGLEMTGHAAVLCSRGLLMIGGLLPLGLTLTMSAWTLDVFGGCREGRQRRRRRSGVVLDMTAAAGGCALS